MKEKAVVLAADNQYIDKLTTTIKSICAHNDYLKFYILNDDLPKEWFIMMKKKLTPFSSIIKDIKLHGSIMQNFDGPWKGINHVAYFRYHIPKIVEEDIALYLDIDIIVTGDITHLFYTDFQEHSLAAVPDIIKKHKGLPTGFNSGVLLLNLIQCRKDHFTEKLLDLTTQKIPQLALGDQGILNYMYPHYLQLPKRYNCQIGHDMSGVFEEITENFPVIIHYLTTRKPWHTLSNARLREIWWYYYALDWSELRQNRNCRINEIEKFVKSSEYACLILTNSVQVEHIEYLVQELSHIQFNIAAYTNMAPALFNLLQYENVFLYPNVTSVRLEQLMDDSKCYLDINHHEEMNDIVMKMFDRKKVILAFNKTKHREDSYYDQIISEENPKLMVEYLQKLHQK